MRKKDSWKDLALDAFKSRCRERIARSNAISAAEIEEGKKKEEEDKLQAVKTIKT